MIEKYQLILVVQFSGNEERWRQFAAANKGYVFYRRPVFTAFDSPFHIFKFSSYSGQSIIDPVTQEMLSVDEMESLLFDDFSNTTSDYNFTAVG